MRASPLRKTSPPRHGKHGRDRRAATGAFAIAALMTLPGCARQWSQGAASATKPVAKAQGEQGRGTIEDPIAACGPRESYAKVATEVRCADGNNPLGGDAERGRQARRGSRRDPAGTGHFLDVYEIPCAEGPLRVWVDMYRCPEADEADGPSRALEDVIAHLTIGDFAAFVDACAGLLASEGAPADALQACLLATPAVLNASGDVAGAIEYVRDRCANMPPISADSQARLDWTLVSLDMHGTVAKAPNGAITGGSVRAFTEGAIGACQLPPDHGQRVRAAAERLIGGLASP